MSLKTRFFQRHVSDLRPGGWLPRQCLNERAVQPYQESIALFFFFRIPSNIEILFWVLSYNSMYFVPNLESFEWFWMVRKQLGVWLDGFLDLSFLLSTLLRCVWRCVSWSADSFPERATRTLGGHELSSVSWRYAWGYAMTCYDYLSLMPLRYNTAINHGSRQVDNVIVARAPRLTWNAWPLACQLAFWDTICNSESVRAMGWGIMDDVVLESSWICGFLAQGQSTKLTETLLFRGKLSP